MARPKGSAARDAAVDQEILRDYIRRAEVSRQRRRVQCDSLRQWYEAGTITGEAARYNKLQSHLDRLASYLWSPDGVRFAVQLPPAARAPWLKAAATARDEFRQVWAVSEADFTVGLALEWSLVYGGVPLKIQQEPRRGFVLSMIDPWDFGVTREDQSLSDQDIMVHWYTLSVPQFERWAYGHPREDALLKQVAGQARQPVGGTSMTRLVITGMTGTFPNSTVSGSLSDVGPDDTYVLDAEVIEPVLHLADVWERRTFHKVPGLEDFEDWRVTTVLSESAETLVRRRNPILPHLKNAAGNLMRAEHPFTMLCPHPQDNYLWGRSTMASLLALQAWRERQIRQMDDAVQRQLDPSKFFSGTVDFQEAGRAMSSPGGSYGSPEQGAKMEYIKVDVGQEAFGLLAQIDQMFADQGGLPPVTQGEAPTGVRAGNQLVTLAGIGSGRVRHMALQLEQCLSRVATLGFRLLQRGDPQTYETDEGQRFLLAQLPPDTALQVSAHSASPIFAEQTQQKALMLMQAGAIDGVWLTELLDPPYREEIKAAAKELAQGRAEHQDKLIELELEKLRRKGAGKPK